MITRILFSLLLVCSLTVTASAQSSSSPCADLAKKHLKTLDQALDLDFKQMKCLKEKAVNFCDKNRQNPPTSKAQRDKRVAAFNKALLECLSPKQQKRVKTHYRNKRDQKARRNVLQAFLEEFGNEVIIIKKRS
jgi:leucyl aminopeptidase (aminopeptidase T)